MSGGSNDDSCDLPVGLTLERDAITVPGQNWALVSFVGPDLRQKTEKLGMKIRGVFATEEEARAHVRRLQRAGDKLVDIYLLDMYEWALIPPDPEKIEDHEYQQEFLQNLMKGHAESERAAKEMFYDRKARVMKDGLDANLLPNERLPPPPGGVAAGGAPNPGGSATATAAPTDVLDAMDTDDAWGAAANKKK